MPDEEEESVTYEIATPPNDNYYRQTIEHFSQNANKLRKVHGFICLFIFFSAQFRIEMKRLDIPLKDQRRDRRCAKCVGTGGNEVKN